MRSRGAAQRARELAHALLVGAADDHGAHAVVHHFLEGDDLAGVLGPAGLDHVVALVECDLGPEIEQLVLDVGVQLHLHLAAAGEHVDGAVVVLADHHAVRVRWLVSLSTSSRRVAMCSRASRSV